MKSKIYYKLSSIKRLNNFIIKSFSLFGIILFLGYTAFGQGNTCSTAQTLGLNALSATFTVNGTGDADSPDLSVSTCTTSSINESWYKFNPGTGYTYITFQNSGDQIGYIYIYSGACGSLSFISCTQALTKSACLLNIATVSGTVYYIRIVRSTTGTVSGRLGVYTNSGIYAYMCLPDKSQYWTGNSTGGSSKNDNTLIVQCQSAFPPRQMGWAKFNTSSLPPSSSINSTTLNVNLFVTCQSNSGAGKSRIVKGSGQDPVTGNPFVNSNSTDFYGSLVNGWSSGNTYNYKLNSSAVSDFYSNYTNNWWAIAIVVNESSLWSVGRPVSFYGWNDIFPPFIVITYNTNGCVSPSITAQPNANIIQCEGTNATFSLTADGTAPLSYQWYKGADLIAGANNASYIKSNVSLADDATTYNCIVNNACGSVTSNLSTLTINSKATLLDSISDITKCQGDTISFSIHAIGMNLSYQWTKGSTGVSLTGATNSVYTIAGLKQTDYDVYSCKVINECGSKSIPNFILTVNAPPSTNIKFVNQTKDRNESASYSVSPGGTGPFAYQWMKNDTNIVGETNSIFNIEPDLCGKDGVYSCKIDNGCGSMTTKIANLFVLGCSRFKYAITGKVMYDNINSTPMTNTEVQLLNMGDVLIDNNTSDDNGYYVFVDLINDSYKLKCSTTKAWGGSNPADALLVNKHYVGSKIITDRMKKLAADVNKDNKINPIDALMINRRYIGVLNSFFDKDKVTVPDWQFSDTTVTIAGIDVTPNILAICTGDINASYIPPSRIMNYELGIRNDKEIKVEIGKPFDIPVYINDVLELGAMGIKLKIENGKLKIIGVKSELEGLIYNISDDGVNIAWSAVNQGFNITPDKPVFILRAVYNGTENPSGFQLKPESIIADINADYINVDKLVMPKLEFGAKSSEFGFKTYPNPFSSITNINYTIPEDANIEINLYNVLGEKIAALVANERREAGNYNLQFDGSSLKQGIYYLRFTNSVYTKTNILMITR